LCYRC